ncbi:FNIP repeat-containing protein [Dictyostelium discoideum AX4]|uniref:FNIP repeat-containing protein DDB_G0277323 n=1 Tax=Dictyostelium discoideum TaxID=44689 RepID=Y7732_DICDI|nr:FNIP repeat-containing protein [Dictyostelium discoideum AX4]Q1ZXK1.1 RecName: Full=FNIP repeat-containing protein DDB_G0277323 [Dictyostelium discoideum]EAS66908.1 FNIP repeat-containing protein [Dictyostelium discoideum AX4]|eukprot:XP_001134592.1 FNIP repeat-containing protein [Dictyostelium discoideum AX4]
MDILFYKVFRNLYIKNIIFKILRLYKNYSKKYNVFKNVEQYKLFKDKEYLVKMEWDMNIEIPINLIPDNTIKYLKFGKYFNQPIKSLPIGVELIDLKYSLNFNQNQFQIPITLKTLILNRDFNQNFTKLSNNNNDDDNNNLSLNKVENISFGRDYDCLIDETIFSKSITSIKLSDSFCQELDDRTLPKTLTFLEFGWTFNGYLKIGDLDGLSKLRVLKFGVSFNTEIQCNVLPNSIEKITFGSSFNQVILPNSLPRNLRILKFGSSFNQPIFPPPSSLSSESLPNLLKLKFDSSFNQPILPSSLSNSITRLEFRSTHFNQQLSISSLPKNLKYLGIFINNYSTIIEDNDNNNNSEFLKIINILN